MGPAPETTAARRRRAAARPDRRCRASPARGSAGAGSPRWPSQQQVADAPVSAATSRRCGRRRTRRPRAARSPAAARARARSTTAPGAMNNDRDAARASGSSGRPGPTPPSVHATVNPPSRQAATLSGWPSSRVGEGQHGVVGQRAVTVRGPAHGRRGRRPTIAAADEPSPRPCGMRLTQCSAGRAAGRRARRRRRASPGRPGASRRGPRSAAPRPVTSTCRPPLGHPGGQVVVQVEREPERVEARPEIGAGRRHPDP